jgi:hypothetical protein
MRAPPKGVGVADRDWATTRLWPDADQRQKEKERVRGRPPSLMLIFRVKEARALSFA